jgi:acyl-CoA thioester hydrolase
MSERASVKVRLLIRWDETDMAGVVFYGNYFRFFELAEDELLRARGTTRPEIVDRLDLWLPRVEAHAEFLRPARFGDEVEIRAEVAEVRTKSFRLQFEIVHPSHDNAPLVRGHVVIVPVSRKTFRSTGVPPALRALLTD